MRRRRDWDLSPDERTDARAALTLLDGRGITLAEAARMALAKDGGPARTTTLEEALDGYLRRLLELKKRGATFRWYEARFAGIARRWPAARLDGISRAQVSEWLETMKVSRATAAGYLRALRAVYTWARSKEPALCATNPTEGLTVEAPTGDRTPGVLAGEHVAAMLAGAGIYRHALALMLFAGIRPEEMAGPDKSPLLFEHVDRKAKTIRIPGEISKTGKVRVLEKLLPATWAWLKGAPAAGRICPNGVRQAIAAASAAIRARDADFAWEPDVLRHTAASMMLAIWQDAGRVSHVLGHEGKTHLLHSRYRGLMTRKEAEAIAALRPPKEVKTACP